MCTRSLNQKKVGELPFLLALNRSSALKPFTIQHEAKKIKHAEKYEFMYRINLRAFGVLYAIERIGLAMNVPHRICCVFDFSPALLLPFIVCHFLLVFSFVIFSFIYCLNSFLFPFCFFHTPFLYCFISILSTLTWKFQRIFAITKQRTPAKRFKSILFIFYFDSFIVEYIGNHKMNNWGQYTIIRRSIDEISTPFPTYHRKKTELAW